MATMYQNKYLNQRQTQNITMQGEHASTKAQKASVSFISKNQRFSNSRDPSLRSPGPGSYQQKTSNYKIPSYHVIRDKDKQSPIKREHQWIWTNNRNSYIEGNWGSGIVGPGSYNLDLKPKAKSNFGGSHTNWGKSQRFYYSSTQQPVNGLPGPGSYQSQKNNNRNALVSVFKSKSPRTYIQKLISQASAPQLRHHQTEQFITNPQIITQQDNKLKQKQQSRNVKSLNSSVFASKIPRFKETKIGNIKVGPGSYDTDTLNKSRSKEKLPKIITVKDEERRKKIVKHEEILPGPGAYDTNLKTIQRSLQQKGGVVIPNQPRFIHKFQRNPGPGHYMRPKNLFQQQLQKSLKSKYSPERPSFNSSSGRAPPQLPTKANPLCNYNLQYYDLQYRVKKNQQHIEKLKIMEVTIPAFNTKARK